MIGLITNCFTDLSVSVAALFLKISTSPKIEIPPDRGGGVQQAVGTLVTR